MSPRTRVLLLSAGLLPLTACGAPPQAETSADPPVASAVTAPSVAPLPSLPGITFAPIDPVPTTTPPVVPTYPTYQPTVTTVPTTRPVTTPPTTAPLTVSPTPTPSHARKCAGEPTGKQILALVEGDDGVPDAELVVAEGPFCATSWSFTTVRLKGEKADEAEVLMVVATGTGGTLAKVAAGTDVCNNRVQTQAPPGIRVMACGF